MAANFNRSDEDRAAFLAKKLPHYHIVRLNERINTPGRVNRNAEFRYLGLKPKDFRGKAVLDVGGLDGVITFNAERKGATRLLAIDVEDPAEQDWGHAGPPPAFANLGEVKNRVFPELKDFFGSVAERKRKTVYDLDPEADGRFDLIFFYGVLYHLRHPLLAFDRLRRVATGAICVETHVCNYDPMLPTSLFYEDDVLDDADSNWSGPTEACVGAWMRDAGFTTVYAEKKPRVVSRQRFVGFVGEPTFEVNADDFKPLNDAYFAEVRQAVESRLKVGRMWRI